MTKSMINRIAKLEAAMRPRPGALLVVTERPGDLYELESGELVTRAELDRRGAGCILLIYDLPLFEKQQ